MDTSTTIISIVMATYNGQKFLKEQLESFLVQDLLPDQLLVTDDGSTDGTIQILENFSKTAPFKVNIISNTNGKGITANFTNGILAATGDIILLSDQDDVWLPQHISKLVNALINDPDILCVASDSYCVDSKLQPLGYTVRQSERFKSQYIKNLHNTQHCHLKSTIRYFVAPGHAMAFKKSIVQSLIPISEYWIYDQWIFLMASIFGKVSYLPDVLTNYRHHEYQFIGVQSSSLASWANKTSTVSTSRELADIYKWEDTLKQCLYLQPLHPQIDQTIINLLTKKIEFSKRRVEIRKMNLIPRVIHTSSLLFSGHYHKMARGVIAALRDLYGHK